MNTQKIEEVKQRYDLRRAKIINEDTFDYQRDNVYFSIKQFLEETKVKQAFFTRNYIIIKADQENGIIVFDVPVTWNAWGERMGMIISPSQNNTTVVASIGQCKSATQVYDWGEKKRITEDIFDYIKQNHSAYNSENSYTRKRNINSPQETNSQDMNSDTPRRGRKLDL